MKKFNKIVVMLLFALMCIGFMNNRPVKAADMAEVNRLVERDLKEEYRGIAGRATVREALTLKYQLLLGVMSSETVKNKIYNGEITWTRDICDIVLFDSRTELKMASDEVITWWSNVALIDVDNDGKKDRVQWVVVKTPKSTSSTSHGGCSNRFLVNGVAKEVKYDRQGYLNDDWAAIYLDSKHEFNNIVGRVDVLDFDKDGKNEISFTHVYEDTVTELGVKDDIYNVVRYSGNCFEYIIRTDTYYEKQDKNKEYFNHVAIIDNEMSLLGIVEYVARDRINKTDIYNEASQTLPWIAEDYTGATVGSTKNFKFAANSKFKVYKKADGKKKAGTVKMGQTFKVSKIAVKQQWESVPKDDILGGSYIIGIDMEIVTDKKTVGNNAAMFKILTASGEWKVIKAEDYGDYATDRYYEYGYDIKQDPKNEDNFLVWVGEAHWAYVTTTDKKVKGWVCIDGYPFEIQDVWADKAKTTSLGLRTYGKLVAEIHCAKRQGILTNGQTKFVGNKTGKTYYVNKFFEPLTYSMPELEWKYLEEYGCDYKDTEPESFWK